MFRNPDSVARGVPLLFNLGFLTVLLALLVGRNIMLGLATASNRAFLCVSGYFRPRPEPWLEMTLRDAFTEFDRDLTAVLHHEQAPR